MSNSNEVGWDQSVWQEINEAVVKEVAKVRTAQKVFPTTVFDTSPTEIPDDVINFEDLSIQEGQTKPLVEIYQEFPLTATQVAKEAQLKTCKTLARMAAKAVALAEDTVIFRGKQKKKEEDEVELPANVKADLIVSAGDGLLGEADPQDADDDDPNKVSKPIDVVLQTNGNPGVLYGENTFSAVAEGIAKLTAKAQAPMFALFLPVKAYADTFVPPSSASLVTTAERIKPLVEGGFLEAVTLPQDKGLLVALAGDPTGLYLGREATTEFRRVDGSKFYFRVAERIQFVARDPRAFVLLNFAMPPSEYKLDVQSVSSLGELPEAADGAKVIIALVDNDLHIRIFDACGEKVVDKGEKELEKELDRIAALKERLGQSPEKRTFSDEEELEIKRDAIAIAS